MSDNIFNNGETDWVFDAEQRIKNRKWLRYSSNIARRILAILNERKDLNQAILAEKIGVKPQQISKVLKGHENLTLETIAKISLALDTELIIFPEYKYSDPIKATYYLRMTADELSYTSAENEHTHQFDVTEYGLMVSGSKEICSTIKFGEQ